MQCAEHPTVKAWNEARKTSGGTGPTKTLDAAVLRDLCKASGAADAGFVEIDRPAMGAQKPVILDVLPTTKSIVSLAFRANREALRTTYHSLASLEFRHTWEQANRSGRGLVTSLQAMGVPALNLSAGFPYEADRWPNPMHFVSDKPIATEAGLGVMGLNRLVLHPRFGSAVVFTTVLVAAEISAYDAPIEYNPCIQCKLCVSACPTAAIAANGRFNAMSCYVHNYRERAGGFVEWVSHLVDSQSFSDYRKRVTDAETVSMWQNLSICPQTRCDRCMAVCPAGEEMIGEFLGDRKGYLSVVKRFRAKPETVYVIPDSPAEAYVNTRFPHKTTKRVAILS
jgi:epoxyqueuosine reductase QueG